MRSASGEYWTADSRKLTPSNVFDVDMMWYATITCAGYDLSLLIPSVVDRAVSTVRPRSPSISAISPSASTWGCATSARNRRLTEALYPWQTPLQRVDCERPRHPGQRRKPLYGCRAR